MKKTAALLLAVLLAAVGLLSGCESEEGLTKIQLAEVTHSVFYAPLYVAINDGFFEKQGIEVELTNAGGADAAMTMVLSGQADIGFMGPEATIYVANEGRTDGTVVIGQLTQCDGAFLVAREPMPDFTWTDLIGTNVIGGRKGGIPEMTLEYVLRKNGVDPKEDLFIDTSVQFAMMGGAFVGGEGDFVALFEPTATEVEAQGQGYIVASIGAASGSVPYTCFQVTDSYLKTNKDLVTRFMTAIYEAQQWVHSHSDAEVAEAVAPSFADTDVETLTNVVKNYREINAWSQNPIMSQESYERLLDIMQQAGELDSRPAYETVIDNTIAKEVTK